MATTTSPRWGQSVPDADDGSPKLRRVALGLLSCHLVLSPTLFSLDTLDAFEFPKSLLLQVTVLLLLGVQLLQWQGTGQARRRRGDALTWAITLFLGSAILSTVFSLSPVSSLWGVHQSHAGLFTLLSYGALFVLTQDLVREPAQMRALLRAALIGGSLAGLYAVVQFWGVDPFVWDHVSDWHGVRRPAGTMGHANHLGALMAMLLPVTVLFLWEAHTQRHWPSLGMWGAVLLVLLAALVTSFSRAAWGGAALALLLGAHWLRSRQQAQQVNPIDARHNRGRQPGAILLCGMASVGLLCAGTVYHFQLGQTGFMQTVQQRLLSLASLGGRAPLWEGAWQAFLDSPLTGWGPETFSHAFARHRPPRFVDLEGHSIVTRAHNQILHVLVTQGLVGGAALAGVFFLVGRCGWRAWRTAPPTERGLVLVLITTLLVWLVQGAMSFLTVGCGTVVITCAAMLATSSGRSESAPPVDTAPPVDMAPGRAGEPAIRFGLRAGVVLSVAHFLLMAVTHNSTEPGARLLSLGILGGGLLVTLALAALPRPGLALQKPHSGAVHWGGKRALVLLGFAGLGVWFLHTAVWIPYRAFTHLKTGDLLLQAGSNQAIPQYREATRLLPGREETWTHLGNGLLPLGRQLKDESLRDQWLTEAIAAHERAAALEPMMAHTHSNLGRALIAQIPPTAAQGQRALECLGRALQLDPRNPDYLTRKGWIALSMRQYALARALAGQARDTFPTFASPWALLALVAWDEGHRSEALEYARQAEELNWMGDNDREAEFVILHCQMELAQGRVDLARRYAEQATRLRQYDFRPHYVLAATAERQREVATALKAYHRTLELEPNFRPAREGLQRLVSALR